MLVLRHYCVIYCRLVICLSYVAVKNKYYLQIMITKRKLIAAEERSDRKLILILGKFQYVGVTSLLRDLL